MEKLDEDAPYKSCSARVFTDESISIILSGELDHIHETNVQKLERQILRTTLAEQDLYGASPSNFSIRRPGGISGLLLQ
jgi:hypothetical protein